MFVSFERGTTGRQAQNERAFGGRFESVNTFNDMTCSPFANFSGGV